MTAAKSSHVVVNEVITITFFIAWSKKNCILVIGPTMSNTLYSSNRAYYVQHTVFKIVGTDVAYIYICMYANISYLS